MKQFLNFLFLCLILIFSGKSFALSCVGTDGQVEGSGDIASTVAVPPTLPVGSVIWRSQQYSVDLRCWQDTNFEGEYVYLYLNIYDPNQSMLGGQIEIGLNYHGRDYLCSSPGMQSGGFCRMQLDTYIWACHDPSGCPSKGANIKATFNFFIAKKKDGLPGQEGSLPNMPSVYPAVQFNGVAGINNLPGAKNYTINLHGLNNLRYVGCSSVVDVIPRTIDFGPISSFSAKKGEIIKERPITIQATKGCTSAYGLNGNFFPVSGNLADLNATLIPANNDSVGIQILNKDDLKKIEFKKEFVIAPSNNTAKLVEKNLLARLLWNSNKAVIGDFNASAKLEIYYK
ncbi:MAG: fimbrial protein [Pseudomonadales bacterium]